MTKHKVHPVAALFPMLNEQELKDLANDIKENGLQQPIMLDKDKQIVDGRNRLAACKIAKVEPKFDTLNGIDPEAYIIAVNLARRNLNVGQRSLVAAKMCPDPEKGGRGKLGEIPRVFPMVPSKTLSQARRILREAPDLVAGVMEGSVTFEKALQEARDREDKASTTENKMRMLREKAPDLAGRVTDGLDIDEALAGMKERERKRIEAIEHGKQAAEGGLTRFLENVASIAIAVKLTDKPFLDKKLVAAVVKAASQLHDLL
jgi:hypothetical protein